MASPTTAAAGTAQTSLRSMAAAAPSSVVMSIERSGFIKVEIGFIQAVTRTSSPLVTPPSRPPALFVGLRTQGIVPEGDDLALVHDVIYDELVLGVVRDESRTAYGDVVRRLVERGAEGVVLGCTEIELLVGPDDVEVPVFATTALHATAAVDFALS